jgi:hypothetical protein
VRENLMHGLTGGGWKRSVGHGHRSEAARRGNPGKSGCGTYRRATSPRQPPTLHGRYYPSELVYSLNRINDYLVRWVVQKYKRYRGHWKRAREALRKAERLYPLLFAHWKLVKP